MRIKKMKFELWFHSTDRSYLSGHYFVKRKRNSWWITWKHRQTYKDVL